MSFTSSCCWMLFYTSLLSLPASPHPLMSSSPLLPAAVHSAQYIPLAVGLTALVIVLAIIGAGLGGICCVVRCCLYTCVCVCVRMCGVCVCVYVRVCICMYLCVLYQLTHMVLHCSTSAGTLRRRLPHEQWHLPERRAVFVRECLICAL